MNEKQLRAMASPSPRFGGDRVHMSTYVPPEVFDGFSKVCRRLGVTQASALRAALADWLLKETTALKKSKAAD